MSKKILAQGMAIACLVLAVAASVTRYERHMPLPANDCIIYRDIGESHLMVLTQCTSALPELDAQVADAQQDKLPLYSQ